MVQIGHPYATYSVGVIASDPDSVPFIIVYNLDTDGSAGEYMHRTSVCTYIREIVDSYERMGRGGVDIGKIVGERGLGRNIAASTGQYDGGIETRLGSYTASPFVRLSSAQTVECKIQQRQEWTHNGCRTSTRQKNLTRSIP